MNNTDKTDLKIRSDKEGVLIYRPSTKELASQTVYFTNEQIQQLLKELKR